MQFPNAYKGVKKIFLAELMMIAVAILGIVVIFILVSGGLDLENRTANISLSGTAEGIAVGLSLVVFILMIVGFFMRLIGVINARKDDSNFKIAFYATLLGIAIAVINGFIGKNQPKVERWLTLGTSICSLFSTYYIISGIASLAEQLGDADVKALAEKARNILCFTFAASAILKLLPQYIPAADLSTIVNVVGYVLEIISYGFFLVVLAKGKKMLAE